MKWRFSYHKILNETSLTSHDSSKDPPEAGGDGWGANLNGGMTHPGWNSVHELKVNMGIWKI